MTKAIHILFSCLIGFLSISKAQNKALKSIHKEADFISTDRLGNLYIIKKNFIWMYNKDGDSLRAFNSQRFGEIENLDTSDPYKLLVFFKDYNIVLFLDNYLSENGDPIDMQTIGLDQVTLACHSREDGFWVFDQIRQKILHLNSNFAITHETVNFNQWFGRRLEPNFMIEYNNQVYLNEEGSGLYVFDHFGTYMKKIPLKNLIQPQILETSVNYTSKTKFCSYSLKDFESKCQKISADSSKQIRIEKGRLYTFDGKKTTIYSTN